MLSCEQCGYCEQVADAAVTTREPVKVEETLKRLRRVRSRIVDGSILY